MKKSFLASVAIIGVVAGFSHPVNAAEWCSVTNIRVTSSATSTSIAGTLTGSGSAIKDWLLLDRTENADAAKTRAAMALSAIASGRPLLVYVTGSYTCVSVPSWTVNIIDHVQTVP